MRGNRWAEGTTLENCCHRHQERTSKRQFCSKLQNKHQKRDKNIFNSYLKLVFFWLLSNFLSLPIKKKQTEKKKKTPCIFFPYMNPNFQGHISSHSEEGDMLVAGWGVLQKWSPNIFFLKKRNQKVKAEVHDSKLKSVAGLTGRKLKSQSIQFKTINSYLWWQFLISRSVTEWKCFFIYNLRTTGKNSGNRIWW